MHSFLVALAYLAMIFAPCAVAQWGDVLMLPFSFRFNWLGRTRRPMDSLLVSLREQRELEEIYDNGFYAPASLGSLRRAPVTFEEAMQAASPERATALETAAARVGMRLAQMVEAHRLANSVVVAESADEVMRDEMFGGVEVFPTPSSAELEALYAVEAPVEAATEANTLHLLPDIVSHLVTALAGDVGAVEEDSSAAETPPISLAA